MSDTTGQWQVDYTTPDFVRPEPVADPEPWVPEPVCGLPYRDRDGYLDTCSFPPNHPGSCW